MQRKSSSVSILHKLARNIRELALLQLRLPEYRVRVTEAMLHPAILLHMIQVNEPSRVGIPMRRSQNTSAPQLQRLLLAQIVSVFRVQHTICECLSRTDTEEVAGKSGAIGVDVVESGAFGGSYARAHCAHGEPHAFVGVDEVGEDFGGCGDGDAALVAEFVESALHS